MDATLLATHRVQTTALFLRHLVEDGVECGAAVAQTTAAVGTDPELGSGRDARPRRVQN